MKIFSLFLFALMLLSCNESQSKTVDAASEKLQQQDDKLKRYNVKSGTIKYKTTTSGSIMGGTITGSGTKSVYFKDYGALELVEEESTETTTVNILGNKTTNSTSSHSMSKLDNGISYSVDFKQKYIYKQQDLAMGLIKQLHPDADAGAVGKEMLEAMGGTKIGTENYHNYPCEIWDVAGVKQWIYKGVTLKSVGTMVGITTTTEAVNIVFNEDVADRNFSLPNYPIIEQENGFNDIELVDDLEGLEELEEGMDRMRNMSYEEWKQQATANDEDMRNMSEAELRETYDMIQKMMNINK